MRRNICVFGVLLYFMVGKATRLELNCTSLPCRNGGTCSADATCACPLGYGGKFCEEKLTLVLCDSDSMTVRIDERLFVSFGGNLEEGDVRFMSSDEACRAFQLGIGRITISTMYDKCGTRVREEGDFIIFSNVVTFYKPNAEEDGEVITREYHNQISVECCLNKWVLASGDFFVKTTGKETFHDKGTGNFSLELVRYANENYDEEEIERDEPVLRNSELFFGVELTTSVRLGLFVDSCWATPTSDPSDLSRQDLIEDGCSAEETVSVDTNLGIQREGFSFNAATLVGHFTQVYIHCQALVCSVETAGRKRVDLQSQCDDSDRPMRPDADNAPDADLRFRRSDSSSSAHTVSYGPLIIPWPDNNFAVDAQESRPASFSLGSIWMLLIGVVSAIIVMVIIVGFAKLRLGFNSLDYLELHQQPSTI